MESDSATKEGRFVQAAPIQDVDSIESDQNNASHASLKLVR